jgi:hypothetical protein
LSTVISIPSRTADATCPKDAVSRWKRQKRKDKKQAKLLVKSLVFDAYPGGWSTFLGAARPGVEPRQSIAASAFFIELPS